MKILVKAAAAAGLLALAACGGGADDSAARNVQEAHDNRADALDDMADNTTNGVAADRLEERADQVRERGEEKAEAIDDNDGPTNAANGM